MAKIRTIGRRVKPLRGTKSAKRKNKMLRVGDASMSDTMTVGDAASMDMVESESAMANTDMSTESAMQTSMLSADDGAIRTTEDMGLNPDFIGANAWDPRLGYFKVPEGRNANEIADELYEATQKVKKSKRTRKVK